MSTNETVAEVLAEMRERADASWNEARGSMIRGYADRIEKALRSGAEAGPVACPIVAAVQADLAERSARGITRRASLLEELKALQSAIDDGAQLDYTRRTIDALIARHEREGE
jgi:hypothetical protein